MTSIGYKKKTKSGCVQCARESRGCGIDIISFESGSAFYEKFDLGLISELQLECEPHTGRDPP